MSKSDGQRMSEGVRGFLASAMILAACLFTQQSGAQVVVETAASAIMPSQPVLPAPATVFEPPTWLILSAAQRAALMPLERDWDRLDTASRMKWLSIATRFENLPAEEQTRMHERMRAWARSTPAERQRARIGFQVAHQLAAEQRQAKWEAYQALSPEKRQELADKAAQKLVVKPSARRAAADDRPLPKSNLVPNTLTGQSGKAITPSILQAKPGATTVFITQVKILPTHQQAGQTKVFADPDLVDSKTLLPKRRLVPAGS